MDDEINPRIEDSQSNSTPVVRERLGNPRWKTEEEWRFHNSASSEKNFTGDKDENEPNEGTSNWDDYPLATEESVDNEPLKNDAWYTEDVMSNEQEDMINEPDQNLLLINVDSNSDNITTESTIINTHPPIFHGKINNSMAANDLILDYANPENATANMSIINNPELNLLSFDDVEDNNKVSNSSDNITSIERQPQENGLSYNFDEFEAFLKNNRAIPNGAYDDNKHEVELTNNSNELRVSGHR